MTAADDLISKANTLPGVFGEQIHLVELVARAQVVQHRIGLAQACLDAKLTGDEGVEHPPDHIAVATEALAVYLEDGSHDGGIDDVSLRRFCQALQAVAPPGRHFLDEQEVSEQAVVCLRGPAVGRPERGEVAQLSRKVHQIVPSRVRNLAESPFRGWEEALEYLDAAARETPLLLVLDEFPEMMAKSPELPGILRAFADTTGSGSSLRILLCGSAMRTMEAIQEYRAPLYGRFDLSMQLHPFRPHEAAEMLPGLSPADRALAYGLLGGMPLYLSWWDAGQSVRDNISRLACRPTAPMLVEGDYLLATETRHGEQLADVLRAIAEGRTRHQEIADAIGADPSRTLRELQKLRLVERLMPVTETEKSRRRIYQITDNFLAFYLRTLGRYRSEIDRGLGDTVLNAVTAGIDDHMGPVWETAFRDYLRRHAAQIHFATVAVGPWWRSGGQDEIDAVVLAGRSRTPVLVGEAKWARKVDARRLLPKLAQKAAALGVEVDTLQFAICARESVTGSTEGTLAVTAADIFTRDTT